MSEMNSNEKDRIGQAEQSIIGLSGRMDGVETRLTGVEERQDEANRGIQTLLNRTGGIEATRGTVPTSNIFAGLALFVSLVGIGMKMLADTEGKIEARVRHAETVSALEKENTLMRVTGLIDDVSENRDLVVELATLAHNSAIRDAHHDERIVKAWDAIVGHGSKADHPLRQTEAINALRTEMNWIRSLIERIDSEGSRKLNSVTRPGSSSGLGQTRPPLLTPERSPFDSLSHPHNH